VDWLFLSGYEAVVSTRRRDEEAALEARSPAPLEDALVTYCSRSIAYLRDKYRAGGDPVYTGQSYVIRGDTGVLVSRPRIDVDAVFRQCHEELLNVPELGALVPLLPAKLRPKAAQYALAALHAFLRDSVSLRVDQKRLVRLARTFVRMWSEARFSVVTLALVSGIESTERPIALDDSGDVKFMRLSDYTKSCLASPFAHQGPGLPMLLSVDASLVVRTRHSLSELDSDYGRLIFGLHEGQLKRATTALRLACTGLVRMHYTTTWFEPRPLHYIGGGSGNQSRDFAAGSGAKGKLDARGVRQAKRAYTNLGGRKGSLALALRRFDSSYEKQLLDDVLLDLVIALESCLTQGARAGSITKELQLRALFLVGNDESSVDELLKLLYDLRGQIVHQGRDLPAALKQSGST